MFIEKKRKENSSSTLKLNLLKTSADTYICIERVNGRNQTKTHL